MLRLEPLLSTGVLTVRPFCCLSSWLNKQCSILSTDDLHEADLAVWPGSLVLMGHVVDNSNGLLWVWGSKRNPCVWEWKALFCSCICAVLGQFCITFPSLIQLWKESLSVKKFCCRDGPWFYQACPLASTLNKAEVPWGRAPSSQDRKSKRAIFIFCSLSKKTPFFCKDVMRRDTEQAVWRAAITLCRVPRDTLRGNNSRIQRATPWLPLGAQGLSQPVCNPSLVFSGHKRCVTAGCPTVSHPSPRFAGEVSCAS